MGSRIRSPLLASLAAFTALRADKLAAPTIPEIPAAFASADAVLLEETNTLTLSVTGNRSHFKIRRRVLVRTWEGADEADEIFPFDSQRWTLDEFAARTVKPDGTIVPVSADLYRKQVMSSGEGWERSLLQFTFPAVRPGVVVEWNAQFHAKFGESWDAWSLRHTIPVLRSDFEAQLEGRVQTAFSNVVSSAPYEAWCKRTKEGSMGWASVKLSCSNIPAYEYEPFSPPFPDANPRVSIEFTADDKGALKRLALGVERFLREPLERFVAKNAAVAALARSVAGASTAADEIPEKLYDTVRDRVRVRPGGWWTAFGMTEGEPRNVDEVLARGDATGPDRTLVLLAALRSLGIEATPIVAIDRTQGAFSASTEADDLQRLLLRVSDKSGRVMVLDPECTHCPAGLADWRWIGAGGGGVAMGPGPAELVALPGVDAPSNSEVRTETIVIAQDGAARISGTLVWQGLEAVSMRERLEERNEDSQEREVADEIPRHSADLHVTLSDAVGAGHGLQADYSFTRQDAAIAVQDRLLVRLPYGFEDLLALPLVENRILPVWWPYGRARQIKVTFQPPDGFKAPRLPAPVRIAAEGLQFQALWSAEADNRILWSAILIVDQPAVPTSQYASARDFSWSVASALRSGIVFQRAEDAAVEVRP